MFERVYVPSSRGAKIVMDMYVPRVSREIEPGIRRPAIVVCPGGGYAFCSEREAEPVALRFLAEGFNVYVVWYRVGERDDDERRDADAASWYQKSAEHVFPLPQHDAAACFRRQTVQIPFEPCHQPFPFVVEFPIHAPH